MTYCSFCDGQAFLLGKLGNLVHLRCQCCGLTFSVPAEEIELEEEVDDEA